MKVVIEEVTCCYVFSMPNGNHNLTMPEKALRMKGAGNGQDYWQYCDSQGKRPLIIRESDNRTRFESRVERGKNLMAIFIEPIDP